MAGYYGDDTDNDITGGFANYYGGDGNDYLAGTADPNELYGGQGNDVLVGSDYITFSGAGTAASPWVLTSFEPSGNDYAEGGTGADLVYGADGDDVIFGGDGDDSGVIQGYSDNYWVGGLYGGEGNDFIDGGRGNDLLVGAEGNDVMLGGDGNDELHGREGDDIADSGAGDDIVNGSLGNDLLTGGTGGDQFVFDATLDAATNVDTITDFEVDVDKIALSQMIFAEIGTELEKKAFNEGKKAEDGNDRVIFKEKKGELYYDHDGKGGDDQVLFAVLDKKLDLSHHDFVMIA